MRGKGSDNERATVGCRGVWHENRIGILRGKAMDGRLTDKECKRMSGRVG